VLKLTEKLWNQKVFALGILIASLSQLALITHDLLVNHSVSEHCEVCIAQDRSDDFIVAADVSSAVSITARPLPVELKQVYLSNAPAATHNRGPPLL
jgi:hypothetical protein